MPIRVSIWRRRLGDLAVIDVAVVRRAERDLEAVRVSGFGQELLRPIRVERDRLHVLARPEQGVGQELARGLRHAAHDALDDRLTVDRLRHGLAHALVQEGVLVGSLHPGVFQAGSWFWSMWR
jgi:hypothetical protein